MNRYFFCWEERGGEQGGSVELVPPDDYCSLPRTAEEVTVPAGSSLSWRIKSEYDNPDDLYFL